MYDDYAHNPEKVAAAIATARERSGQDACSSSSSRTSTPGRSTSRSELGRELAAADVVAVTDVYPAREQPVEGVTGKLVVDALSDARPGLCAGLGSDCSRTARGSSRGGRVPATSCSRSARETSTAPRALILAQLGRS